jgi:integrase
MQPDRKAAAGSTQRRKRSVFYNALGYAVEQGHLPSNPIDRIQWTAPAVAQTVDRRVVVRPAQARTLLAAVRGLSGRGEHLEAFYGCLYFAALRPSEAVMLRESDLHLPKRGWGGSSWARPPPARAQPGPTTAPPGRNAASSTAPTTRHGPSPSRPNW